MTGIEVDEVEIRAVTEYDTGGYLIYAENFTGAFVRGKTKEEAIAKFDGENRRYLLWLVRKACARPYGVTIVQEKESELQIYDADSDVIFDSEKPPLTAGEYDYLKNLALKSAADFQRLYDSIPVKNGTVLAPRRTFYGDVPITAEEMYGHTKNVNGYYFGEIGVAVMNRPDIVSCRKAGFLKLDEIPGFLDNRVFIGSYGEQWSVRKVCRRFVWHDRIHAKAMYRMAAKLCGTDNVENPFCFEA